MIIESGGVKCLRCGLPCREERVRVRRDGSTVIRSMHEDGSPAHFFREWPSVSNFLYRKYPGDASPSKRLPSQENGP